MTYEENETTIVYDYAANEVCFYTTRKGEKRNVIRRLGEENIKSIRPNISDGKEVAWDIRIDLDKLRNPYMITPILSNNDED